MDRSMEEVPRHWIGKVDRRMGTIPSLASPWWAGDPPRGPLGGHGGGSARRMISGGVLGPAVLTSHYWCMTAGPKSGGDLANRWIPDQTWLDLIRLVRWKEGSCIVSYYLYIRPRDIKFYRASKKARKKERTPTQVRVRWNGYIDRQVP